MKLRLWSQKIFEILKQYSEGSPMILFGITGDLDNLGIYVAKNGRSQAENLVDIHNRIIGYFVYRYVKMHNKTIPAFVIIPSGEEIFALGIAIDEKAAENFFKTIQKEVNGYIIKNSPFPSSSVTATFGCGILTKIVPLDKIKKFVILVNNGENALASKVYLKIMIAFRDKLAIELDHNKFQSLNIPGQKTSILLRNCVYFNLLNYKELTKKTLVMLGATLRTNPETLNGADLNGITEKYGINYKAVQKIKKFLRKIKKARL